MRFLSYSNGDGLQAVREIALSKYAPCGEVLAQNMPAITERIQVFNRDKHALRFPAPIAWGDQEKKCMVNMYVSPTDRLKELQREIRGAFRRRVPTNLCPYCGIQSSDTYDHFLDKSTYPEYSALADNLIYVCDKCNTIKNYKGERGKDRILWGYQEVLGDIQFLFCDIVLIGRDMVPSFFVGNPGGRIDQSTFARLRHHFDELDLGERYITESLNDVTCFQAGFWNRLDGRQSLEEYLMLYVERAQSMERLHHKNYYLSVLNARLASFGRSLSHPQCAIHTGCSPV